MPANLPIIRPVARDEEPAEAPTLDRAGDIAPTVYSDMDLLGDPRADLTTTDPALRYELRTTLGEGGMGEVLLCRDRRIGREVAMKRIVTRGRLGPAALEPRFLREARVQGQLEHPAIVPVYDLGKDPHGATFFTMRRVRGETLASILADLRRGDALALREYTLHKLLAAFARVTLAVHFAHTRGVVHRDLKPSNVMLGDFGEVYVLDWGVAKIGLQGPDALDEPGTSEEMWRCDDSGERVALREQDGAQTADGAVLGTPGYMAPEQLCGGEVDHRADVYSLGAILFEILTLMPLHDVCWRGESIEATYLRADCRPSSRAPQRDVPPELDALCVRATMVDADQRLPTARDFAVEIERLLAGNRDLMTRRELAERHAAQAAELAAGFAHSDASLTDRGRALEQAGRAIALDPGNEQALRLLGELLRDVPSSTVPEVAEELDRIAQVTRHNALRRGMIIYAFAGPLVFLPAWTTMGVKSPIRASLCVFAFLLAGLMALLSYRRPSFSRDVPWVMVASSIAIGISSWCYGPFLLAPTLAILNTLCHVVAGRPHQRRLVILLGLTSVLLPLMLEIVGIVPASYAFAEGSMTITSPLVSLNGPMTTTLFAAVNAAVLAICAVGLGRYRDSLSKAGAKSISQAWLLRHLVPPPSRHPPPT